MRYCAQNPVDPLLSQPKWLQNSVSAWMKYKNGGQGPVSPAGFVQFLGGLSLAIKTKECQDMLGTSSENFTLKVQATVNDVSRTLILVARMVKGQQTRYYFTRG